MTRYLPMFLISLIPALMSLAHDIYIYTQNELAEKTLKFASIGWTWAHYHPESLKKFAQTIPEETLLAIEPYFGLQMTPLLGLLVIIIPLLIAAEYFALRLVFGWIGGKKKELYTR